MPRQQRFGRNPSRPDQLKRRLMFKDYLGLALPAPPPRVDWSRGFAINWQMFLNDTLGCCTEAKKGHAVQIWTLDNGRMVTVPDSVVLQAYETDGGYIPGDPSTDQGESMIDNLNDWRANGFGGVELDAYTAIDPTNWLHAQQAIYLFGGLDMGFNVPQSAMDQNAAGQPWTVVPNDGGIVGGHDVWVPMYDTASEMLTCITWGMRQVMTWEFFTTYCDEAYALLSPAWVARKGLSPDLFNLGQLQADLTAIVN
jgi:hypothetical protein